MIGSMLLHFSAISILASAASIGVIFGQAIATTGFFEGCSRQPEAKTQIRNILFIGMFLIEGSFILSFIFAFMIFLKPVADISWATGLAELGIAIGMSISSSIGGLAIGKFVQTACKTIAKLPNEKNKIQALLIILLTLIDTPLFFAFTTCLFVLNKIVPGLSLNDGYRLFSASLAIGIGTIGPTLAQYFFAPAAMKAALFNPKHFNEMLGCIFLSEALIETSALFSFIISLFLIFKKINPIYESQFIGFVFIAIALTISIGGMSVAINIGKIGQASVKVIAENFSNYKIIFKTAAFIQILIESCGLFSFIISLILIGKLLF